MNLSVYNRIAIIGCPGSGKSTLARQIAAQTGHPLIHMDEVYWAGTIEPYDVILARHKQLTQGERWIIDEHFLGTMQQLFTTAGLVIFLEFPKWLCLWRAIRRYRNNRFNALPRTLSAARMHIKRCVFYKYYPKLVIFSLHERYYSLLDRYILPDHVRVMILQFRKQVKPSILALHKAHPEVEFLRLRSRRAVKEFLKRSDCL